MQKTNFSANPLRFLALALAILGGTTDGFGQTNALSVSLNPASVAGFVTLDITLSAAGASPAAVEWTLNYPAGDVANFTPVVGPAAVNKSVRCSSNHCLVYGTDNAPLQNGVVAVLTFQLTNGGDPLVPISLDNGLAASVTADANALSATGLVSYITQPNSFPAGISAALSFAGSFPHIASAQNWDTAINLVNTSAGNANARILYTGQDGGPLAWPMSFPLSATPSASLAGPSLDQTIPANGALVVDSTGPAARPLLTGSARLFTDAAVSGFIRYRDRGLQQEASVPLETRTLTSLTVVFDNTNGIQTGIAATNLTGAPATIPVTIRDDSGAVIASTSLPIGANGQTSFLLSAQFPATANRSGTVKFDPPLSGPISVMGLRFPPSLHFSTIPVLADSDPSSGSFAHLAVNGGWTSTIELVNRGASSALAQLNFYDENGNPLPLQISIPQTGQSALTASANQQMAAHSRLVVMCSGQDSAALQTGSATFNSPDGAISGFIRHHYAAMDQESLLPLETRNAQAYLVSYDNTNSVITGLALANATTLAVNVAVAVRDGSGNLIGTDSIALPAHGHISFSLTDRIAGTANQSGTIEFDTPAGGQISVMGVRLSPPATFSAIPTLSR